MAADELLNRFFYVPTRKDFVANGLIFVCALVLGAIYHYLPIDPATAALIRDPASSFQPKSGVFAALKVQ